MMESSVEHATQEISSTLNLTNFCMRQIGMSFRKPTTAVSLVIRRAFFIASVLGICFHVFSEIAYIVLKLANQSRVEEVAPLLHTFGYGALGIAKMFTLWYKKDVFDELLKELAVIWPVPPLTPKAQSIKSRRLRVLRLVHQWYFSVNILGVWFYNLTPIAICLFNMAKGRQCDMGFVWVSWYPFDKHQKFNHFFVYIFEMYAGQIAVCIMLSTDLLFSAMASHLALLLRLLEQRLLSLGKMEKTQEEYYAEIKNNIKLHQRLIRYCNDLEDAFSFVNLINIVMSSVNICCVVFTIVLLEPLLAVSNKMFLSSALIQVGMLCWYGDDIFHANLDIASAAYNSGWYNTNTRCRRAVLFLIKRSQKPIAFTAMNFTNITLLTYTSILTRSYSYFALLYTMFNEN